MCQYYTVKLSKDNSQIHSLVWFSQVIIIYTFSGQNFLEAKVVSDNCLSVLNSLSTRNNKYISSSWIFLIHSFFADSVGIRNTSKEYSTLYHNDSQPDYLYGKLELPFFFFERSSLKLL